MAGAERFASPGVDGSGKLLDEPADGQVPSYAEQADGMPELGRARALVDTARESRFFALVSILERLTERAERIGGPGPAYRESIRFRHDPDLSFSASDIKEASITRQPLDPEDPLSPKREIFEIVTTFLGLSGAISPLPLFVAEEVVRQEASDNTAQRDFLDVFHHRLISLLYRWCSRYAFPREHVSDASDVWSKRSLCVAGFDAFGPPTSNIIPKYRLLRLLPLFAGLARTANTLELALQELLSDVLPEEADVQVRQFVGGWMPIEPPQRFQLGVANNRLGLQSVLGERVRDRAGRFAIRVGPLKASTYPRFLAHGDQQPVLREAVRLFTRDAPDFDLELVLHKDAVPTLTLSSSPLASELGRDSWLHGKKTPQVLVVHDVMSSSQPGSTPPLRRAVHHGATEPSDAHSSGL